MCVESAAVHIIVISPDGLEEVVAILRLSGTLAEIEEKFELGRGKLERFLIEIKTEIVFIKAERTEGEDDCAGGSLISFQDGLDSQDEFLGAEGLGEVVVDSRFQSSNPVIDLALGGKHQDRGGIGAGVALHFLEDGKAIHAWKHQIKDDQVGLVFENLLKTFPPVVNHIDSVPRSLEVKGYQRGDIDFIFDDQNFLTHWVEVNSRIGLLCHFDSVTILSLVVENMSSNQILGSQPSR